MNVIATAMVSSLGYEIRTACAAARAGLVRRTELPFTVLEGDGSPGLAVGHQASLLGGGFEGDGRLIRLLEGAFRDLLAQDPIDVHWDAKVAFYLAIPASDRERQGVNLMPDEDARADYLEQIGDAVVIDEFARARNIIESAIRMARFPSISINTLRVAVSGHTAILDLYQRAQSDFQSGAFDLAIVAGVDSLVTRSTLNWLHLTHRLNGAESPAGLFPGEAAALVVLQNPSGNSRASHSGLARIDHVAVLTSPTQFLSGQAPDGKAQFQILRTLIDAVGAPGCGAWFVVDQNGEVFRANEWGCSLVRLQGPQAVVWYPAASFGDVGAASGAVATCMAVRAFERGYAPSPHAVLTANSDGADRAGCVVSALEY